MKAAQILKYSSNLDKMNITINKVDIPDISNTEVLIKVQAAAVNPLDILIITGKIKLIQDYSMPLILGNECSGIIEAVGSSVTELKKGDFVYTRLPINKIGAFAEYVAVDANAVAKMPEGYSFEEGAAIPIAGLTAYQAFIEELEIRPKQSVLITGGSGSFGQIAVPIAKKLGLSVFVSGNERAKENILSIGADEYIEYTKENYWDKVKDLDYIIDTLGESEFNHELSVLKKGGTLLSLRGIPNKHFAEKQGFSFFKRKIFEFAGKKFDNMAKQQDKKYRFMFVHSNGQQLKTVTKIIEEKRIIPQIDTRIFGLDDIPLALDLVANKSIDGKVIIRF